MASRAQSAPDLISRAINCTRSKRDDHFCTMRWRPLCLELVGDAGDVQAGRVLEKLSGRVHRALSAGRTSNRSMEASSAHQRLRELMGATPPNATHEAPCRHKHSLSKQ